MVVWLAGGDETAKEGGGTVATQLRGKRCAGRARGSYPTEFVSLR